MIIFSLAALLFYIILFVSPITRKRNTSTKDIITSILILTFGSACLVYIISNNNRDRRLNIIQQNLEYHKRRSPNHSLNDSIIAFNNDQKVLKNKKDEPLYWMFNFKNSTDTIPYDIVDSDFVVKQESFFK